MKYEETANRLKQAMQDKHLSQQQLANASGVSKFCISHYINGRNIPDNIQAFKLSRTLEVSPEWLMGLDKTQNFVVVENNQLQQEISTMSPDQAKALLKYAQKLKKGRS